jgi:hypothetical protein
MQLRIRDDGDVQSAAAVRYSDLVVQSALRWVRERTDFGICH